MRGVGSGSLACMMIVMFVVLLGCLSRPTQCRPQPLKAEGTRRSSPDSLTNTSSNATAVNSSLDRSKLKLIFCEKKPGNDCFIHCFCCLSRETCWPTETDCRLNCPVCNPKCPPQTAVEGRPLHQ
ncbi:hypothetical protein PVAP13_4KG316200 [Panicum virgatum]|uniref:Uncharacterized protein n=1 Tax=Panicum virgatum TaxID=38727 RepID=A0A8T0TL29_PANVG|nr:hypothetical protein PVAP13_4KG316200 [Panicum virgatum]